MFELVLHLLDLLVPLLDGLAHHGDVLPAGLRVRPAARGHDGSVKPRAELLDLSVLVVTDTSHLVHLAVHLPLILHIIVLFYRKHTIVFSRCNALLIINEK